MKHTLHLVHRKLLADTITPVNIYLKLRDVFAGSILLESSDYHGHENSLSFICCDPIATFSLMSGTISASYPDGTSVESKVSSGSDVLQSLEAFRKSFQIVGRAGRHQPAGLYGFMAYDLVRYFEKVEIHPADDTVPDLLFSMYRYVIIVDHFTNELTLVELKSDPHTSDALERLEKIIFSNRFSTFPFRLTGNQSSNFTDEGFEELVRHGIQHCQRGDVFQIVLSRRFRQGFQGDEFNVYRALRSINPSPYLFYFDFGNFKIFGSSPEAQLQVRDGLASIYPIAGTFRRTGNDQEDAAIANRLTHDEKENSEHVMLVDLARNDLSRKSSHVKVEVFKEIQYYSHVIHLVSKVTGHLSDPDDVLQLTADTFPAGTLSGAPKPMALSLINRYEQTPRGFYGGAIGFLGLDGSVNMAIMIRTFLSQDNTLISQAGAGVVARSNPASERQEVNNKLEALRKALAMAQTL
ncbi:MAG: anthranilate synthase component I family protein [Cyclobacteriaceae bacterium]